MELHGREIADEICLKIPDFHVTFRDLLHAVNHDMGPTDLLPFRRKECWGFFRPEKSNGFGRVWAHELVPTSLLIMLSFVIPSIWVNMKVQIWLDMYVLPQQISRVSIYYGGAWSLEFYKQRKTEDYIF